MSADVSSLARYLSGNRTSANGSPATENQSVPITRDLLGGGGPGKIESEKELDLDLHVPTGWEKRLDLKSGKVYIQRCSSSPSTTSISGSQRHPTKLQELNSPTYSPSKLPSNRSNDPCLDLKLVSSSPSSSSNYQSVCTLDKVKSALERAEKEPTKRRSPFWKPSYLQSPSCSSSSSSTRETTSEQMENGFSMSPVATGCPICLAYVLVSVNHPKCPRCNVTIPLPKRPKIDLNMSF